MRFALLLLVFPLLPRFAVAAEPPSRCSVVLIRGDQSESLGEFAAKVGEETETLKTYAISGTKLKAKVSVYYTDESIRIEVSPKYVQDTSIRIALAVTERDDDSVLNSPEASVAEAAIVSQTQEKNLLRVIKFVSLPSGKFVVAAECREK